MEVELSSSGERLEVIIIRRRGIFQRAICFVHDSIHIGVEKINSRLRSCGEFKIRKDIRLEFGLKKCSVLSSDRGMKLSLE